MKHSAERHVDCDCPFAGNELGDAIEHLGIVAGHLLLGWLVGPVDWRQHQKVAVGAGFEELAARLVQRRKALVLQRDHAIAHHKRSPGSRRPMWGFFTLRNAPFSSRSQPGAVNSEW